MLSFSLGPFVELDKALFMFSSPFGQTVRAAAMNDGCRRARTRKLCILGEDIEAILLGKNAVGYKLFALLDQVWLPPERRWALLQYSG